MKKSKVSQELEKISKRHFGILRPRDVVKYAEDPDTALHDKFEWDDSLAGAKYRLQQAAEIIRVQVQASPIENKTMRVYVSCASERASKDHGYRPLESVMGDKLLRKAYLSQALAELESWQNNYHHLTELAKIFEAADTTRRKLK